MTLYLFKHSNYYNRILKRYDNINDYIQNSIQLGVYQGINFKPYDGVQTSQILNHQGDTPDYIICVDDSLAIDSRWYVVEDERLLNGQYRYTLIRDVIADYYNDILTAPCFVEKALLKVDDKLIYNDENMIFNQIKTAEGYLKDDTECRWIVGYIDRDTPGYDRIPIKGGNTSADTEITLDVYTLLNNTDNPIYVLDSKFVPVLEFPFEVRLAGSFIGTKNYNVSKINIAYNSVSTPSTSGYEIKDIRQMFLGIADYDYVGAKYDTATNPDKVAVQDAYKTLMDTLANNVTIKDRVNNIVRNNMELNTISLADYNTIIALNNKICKYGSNTFKVVISESTAASRNDIYYFEGGTLATGTAYSGDISTATNILNIFAENQPDIYDRSIANNSELINNCVYGSEDIPMPHMNIHIDESAKFITIKLETISSGMIINNFPGSNGRDSNDSGLYDMFAMPYDYIFTQVQNYITGDAVQTYNIDDRYVSRQFVAMRTAQAIAKELGKARCYDIQILPYCPCTEYITNGGDQITLNGSNATAFTLIEYTLPGGGTTPCGVLIWCQSSKINLNLNAVTNTRPFNKAWVDLYNETKDPLIKKVNNLTKRYRLCSPGYSSIFEFSGEMNNGVQRYQVQMLCQPYNPFIRVSPVFKNMYGVNSQYDSKGLILKGDFSLPILNDPWVDYQVQNKYFNEIYNRDIESLELKNSIERKLQIAQAITGTVQGTTSGAAVGAMAGGGVGAAIGSAVGGTASALGGVLDVRYGDILREEALDYKKDMFGYNLANIQALPNSLSKTSPLSDNNPVWPIIEEYSATDEEIEALENKIKYNGMSVGVISKLIKYIDNKQYYKFDMYFKGTLVRLDSIYADSHIVNAISNELNRGIYL